MAEKLSDNLCKVRFLPDNIETTVARGANLLDTAVSAGVFISASCGGKGVCGTCRVNIVSGSTESRRSEKISEEEYRQGLRLACQTRVLSDLTVSIPVSSRLDQAVQAAESQKSAGITVSGWKYSPPLKKYYLELPPATLDDNTSDLFRLKRGLKQDAGLEGVPTDFDVLKKLPGVLRRGQWKVTVTLLTEPASPGATQQRSFRIINIEEGDTRSRLYALAVDVGTTTVCAQLLDLNRGRVVADAIVFNKQISYGADVITRIAYCQKPEGLDKLQSVVVASINEVIEDLLARSRVDRKDIGHITVAGNTTMQHILLGLDPTYIRLAPYTPAAVFIPLVKAASLGINVPGHVYIYTFPSVSSYVGGDIVSGVISSGIYQSDKLTFYMDVGTNGEIVVGNSDWMVTASCSAGPAFEGGGIKHGMVATAGAIQDFSLDRATLEPEIKTIGGARPRGICGSGLINTIAELLEAGVVSRNGKINAHLSSPRIRQGADGNEYVLAWASETDTGQDIVITEVDIDNLVRAKAAMYAGCHTLSKSVNITCADFERVIIAGNFGSSLNVEKAITIGLLPDIARDRFVFVGNGSLSGARLVNFSTDILDAVGNVARRMTNIELSENNDFTDNYIAALFLPHTDEKAFSSVTERLNRNNHLS